MIRGPEVVVYIKTKTFAKVVNSYTLISIFALDQLGIFIIPSVRATSSDVDSHQRTLKAQVNLAYNQLSQRWWLSIPPYAHLHNSLGARSLHPYQKMIGQRKRHNHVLSQLLLC